MAADARSFLRLTTDFLLYRPMKLFRPPGFNRERRIRLRGGVEILYRLNRGDIWAIHEVWIGEIYRMPLQHKPAIIVDLGANIGMTALWLAKKYGCSRLIAVEPVQANAELARRNMEQNGVSAEVIVAAVGADDGTATLQETASSTNSTVTFEREGGEKGRRREAGRETSKLRTQNSELNIHPFIPVVSMETVLKSLPEAAAIDVLKMDIEGSEGEVLGGEVGWLARVRALIAEFHPAHADPDALTAILENAGLIVTPREITEENIAFFTRREANDSARRAVS